MCKEVDPLPPHDADAYLTTLVGPFPPPVQVLPPSVEYSIVAPAEIADALCVITKVKVAVWAPCDVRACKYWVPPPEMLGPAKVADTTVTVAVPTPPLLSVAVIVNTLFEVTGPYTVNKLLGIVKFADPEFNPAVNPLTVKEAPLGSVTLIVLIVSAASVSE